VNPHPHFDERISAKDGARVRLGGSAHRYVTFMMLELTPEAHKILANRIDLIIPA
jgi:hypothetical protein